MQKNVSKWPEDILQRRNTYDYSMQEKMAHLVIKQWQFQTLLL